MELKIDILYLYNMDRKYYSRMIKQMEEPLFNNGLSILREAQAIIKKNGNPEFLEDKYLKLLSNEELKSLYEGFSKLMDKHSL